MYKIESIKKIDRHARIIEFYFNEEDKKRRKKYEKQMTYFLLRNST